MHAGNSLTMAEIEIEIDGQKLSAKPQQTIIQVADDADIYIPRFCYHKHLSIPANCRMCLVEIEKAPKVMPACSTPVTPGMKVFTRSKKTMLAQRSVMEYLLINHPLDCPICDQGGECELQDLSMGYGSSWSHYKESKRSVADQDLGPLISTEMTRCIYCTRCVRFEDELAGIRELGAIGRGEFTEISTYIQHAIHSEVSGNIIDLCPVGALTSKPFRFTARAWELDQAPSISPHDCIGSNLHIHTRYGKVMRVVARENKALNETWLSDRDRFSYMGLYHNDRLEEPLARIDGELRVVDWQTAFEMAADGIGETIAQHGSDKFGALASPNATLEEFYLLQKIVRALDSPHIDHRLLEVDTAYQTEVEAFPGFNMTLSEIEQAKTIFIIGSNIQKEQPMVAMRVRKATLKGANVVVLNPVDYDFNFKVHAKHIVAPHEMVEALARTNEGPLSKFLESKEDSCVLVGALALHHPKASQIRHLAQTIAAKANAKIGFLTDGANSAGGWLAGAVPHRHTGCEAINLSGLNAHGMLEKPRKGYLLLNVEPDLDCANPSQAIAAIKHAQCVVSISMYRNEVLASHAHVIFPMAAFTENEGTYINALSDRQSFHAVSKVFASSRPAWKILRVLGNFLKLDGFDFEHVDDVRSEVVQHIDRVVKSEGGGQPSASHQKEATGAGLSRIGEIPIYAIDSLVRRSKPLQETQAIMEGDVTRLRLHPETAKQLKLKDGDTVLAKQHGGQAKLTVLIDPRIAENAAWIAGGIPETSTLSDLFGTVTVEKV